MSAIPKVEPQPERLKESSWKEYGLRFLFGGTITAVVGIVAKAFGPVVAGLFLAFPAILPASLTLVAEHENDTKASAASGGAIIGSVGLIAFALVVWQFASRLAAWLTLTIAMIVWLAVSLLLWVAFCWVRERAVRG